VLECDGSRPKCSRCNAKDKECVYREPVKALLKRTLAELDDNSAALEVFQAIQNHSEEEAAAIVKRIRSGAPPEHIVRQIREGDLLLQMQLAPETRLRYDCPYGMQMPETLQSLPNPYLHSLIYDWAPKARAKDKSVGNSVGPVQYLTPYGAAALADPRIDKVVPSRWTAVSTDDDLMRNILRAYFQFEYPFFSFFHMDCFLDDMLAGQGQSCSSLLVNAVLATGCVSWGDVLT
jgi:hypothetical protein